MLEVKMDKTTKVSFWIGSDSDIIGSISSSEEHDMYINLLSDCETLHIKVKITWLISKGFSFCLQTQEKSMFLASRMAKTRMMVRRTGTGTSNQHERDDAQSPRNTRATLLPLLPIHCTDTKTIISLAELNRSCMLSLNCCSVICFFFRNDTGNGA